MSDEPVLWSDAFLTVRKILRLSCTNNWLWINALSEKWRLRTPNRNDIANLTALMPAWMRVYVPEAVSRYFSRWRVLLMIDYLERVREVHGKKVMAITGQEKTIIPFEVLVEKYRNVEFSNTGYCSCGETKTEREYKTSVYPFADEWLMTEYGITENHYNNMMDEDQAAIHDYYEQMAYGNLNKIFIGKRLA